MDTFDPHYDVETKELVFTECNKNQFIDGKLCYVLDDDYKYNFV